MFWINGSLDVKPATGGVTTMVQVSTTQFPVIREGASVEKPGISVESLKVITAERPKDGKSTNAARAHNTFVVTTLSMLINPPVFHVF
jgi:hypothetical protein